MPSSDELLERIDRRLQILIALESSRTLDGLTQTQKIERLARLGLDARLISDATGIPLTTVSPVLSKMKKAAAPGAKAGT